MQPIFFNTLVQLREWIDENQEVEPELWVGIYRKESGIQVFSRAEVVDEAFCFGWVESRVKKIDANSYAVRFSPRKAGSRWSVKNIDKAKQLMELGLLEPAGERAFRLRDKSQDGYDEAAEKLGIEYEKQIQKSPYAWNYFQNSSPSYRKTASRWVMQAKREETRLRRLKILIESSEKGVKIPLLS